MKKSKFLGLIMSFALIWPFMFSNNVQAANGWPEAYYNGSMSRWEFDISQSPLYENTQGMYEGTQDMVYLGNLQSSPYWEQDPSAKNMFYTSKPFNPGAGSYNTITIQYPSDNGVWWRHIYLDYIGPVEVKYLEVGTNNVLAPVNYVAGKGGDTFNIQSQQIPGYQLDHVEGTESGTFKSVGPGGYYEHTTNLRLSGMVRYYYKKIAVGADVTVKYVDESGNEVSTTETLSGNVGEAYTSTQKTISGYTFKEVQGSATGTFTEEPQTVTYVYTKDVVAGADVTVKYVDESGNEISATETLSGNIGEAYTSTQKTISGYTFKEVQGSATGTFTEEPQTVTYVYTKDVVAGADVTVKYVDESGNEISATETLSGNIGEAYTSTQKTISGYTFKEIQGSATGTFTEEPQTVTYVYTKDVVAGADDKDKKISIHNPTTPNNFNHPAKSENLTTQKSNLPKTGEQKAVWLTLIGVLLSVSTGGYLYFRKEGNH